MLFESLTPLEQLLHAGTAVVSDVFDTMGQSPLVLDNSLFPIGSGRVQFCGPAYTISGESHQVAIGGVIGDRPKLAAIDAMPRGVVAVWAGNDIKGACCFGDLLASAMRARGCAGAVVDGGVRDSAFLRECGLPVLARYRTPAQGMGRWRVTAAQTPVRVRGALNEWVLITPGDMIVADEDGVIAIPQKLLGDVLIEVARCASENSEAREEIARGLPLLAAVDKYGHL